MTVFRLWSVTHSDGTPAPEGVLLHFEAFTDANPERLLMFADGLEHHARQLRKDVADLIGKRLGHSDTEKPR